MQYFNVTGQWEIFSEWVTFEAVIGENASQVGVIGEEHAIHVPNFAFIPIGSFENLATWIDWRQLVSVRFHSDSRVKAERQQIVDDLERQTSSGFYTYTR